MKTISSPLSPSSAVKSETVHGFRILRDVKVPMRDGVNLSANIFLPDVEGRYPVVFERMPYGGNGRDPGEFYAQRGYAFVIQDCRGRHDSEGQFYPFRDDTPDGLDSLDWICAQPLAVGLRLLDFELGLVRDGNIARHRRRRRCSVFEPGLSTRPLPCGTL